MHAIVDFLKSLYNAERLLELARALLGSPLGIAGLFGIIFAETGLLVGFFLPGDSLLFSVGFASGAAGVIVGSSDEATAGISFSSLASRKPS